MSRFRGTSGRTGERSVALLAAGFSLFGLFLVGGPRAVNGIGANMVGQEGVTLVPGADSSSSCMTYPCATVSISSSGRARISLSLGIDSDDAIQPETYYTDLLVLTNPTNAAISVTSVALSGIAATSQYDFGSLTLYYCRAQTNTPATGCEGSYTAGSQAGGYAFKGVDLLAPGASRYLELSGFAGVGSRIGVSISFIVEVTAG